MTRSGFLTTVQKWVRVWVCGGKCECCLLEGTHNCNDSRFLQWNFGFYFVLWYCYLLVVALIDPSSLLLLFLSCLLRVFLSLYLVVLQPVDLMMSFFLLFVFVPLYSSLPSVVLVCVLGFLWSVLLDFESFTMHTWNNRFFIWEKLHRGWRSHQKTAELVDFVVAGCQEAASLSKERFSVLDI